jgi:hypothetical protein
MRLKSLDKYEAAELLSPLVWPMLGDKVDVNRPVAGNMATSGVQLSYNRTRVTLTTEQYDLFRTEVLVWFAENYWLKPITLTIPPSEIDRLVRERILEVFEEE